MGKTAQTPRGARVEHGLIGDGRRFGRCVTFEGIAAPRACWP
jgi:hypothetical protein